MLTKLMFGTLSGRRLEEIADVDAVHAREDVHLTHAVKNLLHTVLADVHVAGKMGQPAALALRAPAHGAVFFKNRCYLCSGQKQNH